jgi:glyoxalase family protein
LVYTERLFTQVLGFRRTRTYQLGRQQEVTVFEIGPGGAGAEVHVAVQAELPAGHAAIGGVHHVAFRTPDTQEHEQWRALLTRAGVHPTPVIDRFYFHSIYFREPEGILCEIATDGPGFATDEDVATLGERLALPPFLESRRQEIEANLQPITPIDFSSSKGL